MAERLTFVCGNCGHAIEAWSDGNPYYIDDFGKKQYAYHPDHEKLARCIGNDDPHLCLSCAHEFMNDSRAPVETCPRCSAPEITGTFGLDGKPCPFCRGGEFAVDPRSHCIS